MSIDRNTIHYIIYSEEASEGLQRVADKMSQEIDDNTSVKINDIKVE